MREVGPLFPAEKEGLSKNPVTSEPTPAVVSCCVPFGSATWHALSAVEII
ncbi:predicted protein [Plenodomus lingam JN3]|uniref:Predicted protein n=1 Tax=Leptosphaeria maculans (strain JN3 / isolate v23.1.3 / race Av1-4-5-6-7-8) TaxID=985895 RepID=E4ZSS1_LEPMJ|nr:predicted protein [Plenodomus lingam JN3]CBX94509.1 predicted protein [Plenodomus lingam JN3]